MGVLYAPFSLGAFQSSPASDASLRKYDIGSHLHLETKPGHGGVGVGADLALGRGSSFPAQGTPGPDCATRKPSAAARHRPAWLPAAGLGCLPPFPLIYLKLNKKPLHLCES